MNRRSFFGIVGAVAIWPAWACRRLWSRYGEWKIVRDETDEWRCEARYRERPGHGLLGHVDVDLDYVRFESKVPMPQEGWPCIFFGADKSVRFEH